jgi:limonene-1,2-epoxide hydrolase
VLDRRSFDYVQQDVETRKQDGQDPAVRVYFDDGQSCLVDGVASIRGREDQWIVLQTEEDETVFVPIERILRVTVSAGGRKRAAGFAVEDVADEAGSGLVAEPRTSSD